MFVVNRAQVSGFVLCRPRHARPIASQAPLSPPSRQTDRIAKAISLTHAADHAWVSEAGARPSTQAELQRMIMSWRIP
eukprot:7618181-Lingulodinium_polyedra.AAC.1